MNNFEIVHHMICRRYFELYKNCPSISKHIPKIIDRITAKDCHGQVTLLPYFFRASLESSLTKKISDEMVIRLGVANLAGWVAYRIYDDFLDGAGKPELLPLASMSLRHSMAIYLAGLPAPLHPHLHALMDRMDESNAWEREMTYRPRTIPDYKKCAVLGYKSLLHCLGPIAILAQAGYTAADAPVRKCISFFCHYLVARQLSDDALDWKKDLERGFVNSVAVKILMRLDRQYDPVADMTELERIFKYEIRTETVAIINRHISHAEIMLRQNTAIRYKEYLQSLLDSLKIGPKTSTS
jgi:hypothetical protein